MSLSLLWSTNQFCVRRRWNSWGGAAPATYSQRGAYMESRPLQSSQKCFWRSFVRRIHQTFSWKISEEKQKEKTGAITLNNQKSGYGSRIRMAFVCRMSLFSRYCRGSSKVKVSSHFKDGKRRSVEMCRREVWSPVESQQLSWMRIEPLSAAARERWVDCPTDDLCIVIWISVLISPNQSDREIYIVCTVGCTKVSKSCRNSNPTWCKLYLYERRPKMQKKWFLGHFPRRATIL